MRCPPVAWLYLLLLRDLAFSGYMYSSLMNSATEVAVCVVSIFTNLILLEVTLFTDCFFLDAQSTHNAAFCHISTTVNKYVH